MRTRRLMVTSMLLFGSLWGLAELGLARLDFSIISTAPLLTAAGIFFLVLSRQVCDVPGSSLLVGTLAAGFKFLNQPFFGCQFAAVLVLAGVFELIFTIYRLWEKKGAVPSRERLGWLPVAQAATAAFLSFSAFVLLARFGLHNPFWVNGGLEKIVRFTVLEAGGAALLAVPSAWAALRLAPHLLAAEQSWSTTRWLASLTRISHQVSTAGGAWQSSVVLFANRSPRRSATTTASPDSRKSSPRSRRRRDASREAVPANI